MSTKRCPDDLKDRAVRMVLDHQSDYASQYAAIKAVAAKLDIGAESLRLWVRKSEVDTGKRPGVTSEEYARVKELEREVKELRRANEILKAAASFFAREPDPPRRWSAGSSTRTRTGSGSSRSAPC
ncbi:transposase [Georgenia yuyongxinii]|uniref:Transposase n=1 Tax=Georgenia yuyongxinii TaxID=2589797 RepID=A0A5B8C2U2_9MICO|nr:transposase [Georgenia yuyongxinii]QDC23841.1 transposase [Georgenia yuyongxinii]